MPLPLPKINPEKLKLWNYWLNTIDIEVSEQLNEWENQFLDSIGQRLEDGLPLSEKQAEKLEHIYAKYIS